MIKQMSQNVKCEKFCLKTYTNLWHYSYKLSVSLKVCLFKIKGKQNFRIHK